ncbi:MAG: hypothetical protein Q9166_004089 [cf. Caloplaca sp. 2 TL-2023]
MTDLAPILDRLGLGRYLDVFIDEEVRDELKSENLSFTDIAKRVGEKWQVLTPEEREPYEAKAGSAREGYLIELAQYKKSDHYKEYARYLAEFKAKHASEAGAYESE